MADSTVDPDLYTKLSSFTSTYHRDVYPGVEATRATAAGKYVLITGASQGLGRAVVSIWAAAGAAGIVLCSRNVADLEEVTTEIKHANSHTKFIALACNVADSAAVKSMFDKAKEEFGRLDVVVANAGIGNFHTIGTGVDKPWWDDFEINLRGAQITAHHYLQTFGQDVAGTFITLTSGIAGLTIPGGSSYSIAKLALVRLMEYLDLESPNLKAFCLDPGVVRGIAKLPAFQPFAHDTTDLLGAFQIWLASGKADGCRGGYVHVTWDVEELEKYGDVIRKKALLKTIFLGDKLGTAGELLKS